MMAFCGGEWKPATVGERFRFIALDHSVQRTACDELRENGSKQDDGIHCLEGKEQDLWSLRKIFTRLKAGSCGK